MKWLLFVVLLVSCYSIQSEVRETESLNTNQSEKNDPFKLFWEKLYAQGGWSLYCGFWFNNQGKTADKGQIVLEHIYPLEWIIQSLPCANRFDCYKKDPAIFKKIEADLHNIYPVWWDIHSTKLDASYGEIPGEEWRFNICDYERRNNIAEPRTIARGNIARAIFYMHQQYSLPIERSLLDILQRWNLEDLPSEQEIHRNNLIEKIQGNRNIFIDNPKLVNKLKIVTRID